MVGENWWKYINCPLIIDDVSHWNRHLSIVEQLQLGNMAISSLDEAIDNFIETDYNIYTNSGVVDSNINLYQKENVDLEGSFGHWLNIK